MVRHQSLDLTPDFRARAISGTATLDFQRRAASGTTLSLDGVGFRIESVKLATDGGPHHTLTLDEDYSYDGDTLVITIGEKAHAGQVVIEYRAVPRQGLYFLAPDREVPDRPLQVWSQCQDEDGRHWFPCQDKPHVKMTSEMRVTVPRGMTVLSGGELLEQAALGEDLTVFHYALDVPTPAYLMSLVIGTFDEWTDEVELPSGRKIPLRFLVPVGSRADGKRAFGGTARMIRLFSEKTGVEYPWSRYSQVVVSDFIFGGMENTTATTMYEHILIDKTAEIDIESHDLVAHELAHQWFGDLVTCRDWPHAWLNEGFATYFELVEKEDRLGRDAYDEALAEDIQAYLGEARGSYQRAIVCRDYDEPIDLFDRHLYQKGGVVLHLLRRKLGDACFWKGVQQYLERHRGGIVETTDLVRSLEEVSGLSLDEFFDQWVYRPGHPELQVKLSYDDGVLSVDVEQTQKGADVAVFRLPLLVEVTVDGQTTRHSQELFERKGTLAVKVAKRPSLVVLDPDYQLAGSLHLSGPQDLLRAMLEKAPLARSRKMAASALSRRHDPESVAALGRRFHDTEETWIVRAAAAAALGKIRGQDAEDLLLRGEAAAEAKVRRALAQALGKFDDDRATEALTRLTRDASYLVTAAAARSLGSTRRPEAQEPLQRLLERDSWADVVRAGALDGLVRSGIDGMETHLIEWSRYGKPLRARRAAIAGLPEASDAHHVRDHLVFLLRDRDPHLRVSVLSALATLGDRRAAPAISELLQSELDGRVRRRAKQVLSELGKTGNAGLGEVRQKSQKLEQEISTLKVRLAKLEQLTERPKGKDPRGEPAPEPAKTAKAAKAAKTGPARRKKTAKAHGRKSSETKERAPARRKNAPPGAKQASTRGKKAPRKR